MVERGALAWRRRWWWTWSQCSGVGVQRLQQLDQAFGGLEPAWEAPAAQLLALPGIGPGLIRAREQLRQRLHAVPLRCPPRLLLPFDAAMPEALVSLATPPLQLHWRGHGPLWGVLRRRHAVAVVGTRRASLHGCHWARLLGRSLAQAGWPVLSGLAEGIDAEAHRGCLEAGGQPVAVLGTPLERVYPRHHRDLQRQVAQQGLLVTEQSMGAALGRAGFARRNRLLVALASAVVVVECPSCSGALQAAQWAQRLGRPVWVVPADANRESAAGSNGLLGSGAQPLLDPRQWLQQLGVEPQPLAQPAPPEPVPHPLLELIGSGASFEQLLQRSGQSAAALSAELIELERSGLLEPAPGLCWRPRHNGLLC